MEKAMRVTLTNYFTNKDIEIYTHDIFWIYTDDDLSFSMIQTSTERIKVCERPDTILNLINCSGWVRSYDKKITPVWGVMDLQTLYKEINYH